MGSPTISSSIVLLRSQTLPCPARTRPGTVPRATGASPSSGAPRRAKAARPAACDSPGGGQTSPTCLHPDRRDPPRPGAAHSGLDPHRAASLRRPGTAPAVRATPKPAIYQQIGRFDALVCAAVDVYLVRFPRCPRRISRSGTRGSSSDRSAGSSRALPISDACSLTLVSGHILDDPIVSAARFASPPRSGGDFESTS